MIYIKSSTEIAKMKVSGRIVYNTLKEIEKHINPGISTRELDKIAKECILSQGAKPSFLGYNGYPASICASVNEVVIHGIPSDRILKDGDIISIDVGAVKDGYHGDAARTFAVGNISPEAKRLIAITKQSFFEGLKYARHGERLGSVQSAIQKLVEDNGFGIVRKYCGHGIGKSMHEDPEIPNHGTAGRGIRLVKGMTIAVEPMVTYGAYHTTTLSDNWTVTTLDKSLSAHYENTILITDSEPVLLTDYDDEVI